MLQGETIILGPLVQSDGQAVFRWLNDPAIMRSNGEARPMDGTAFANWFAAIGRDPTRVLFAIRPRGDARLLGFLTIRDIHAVFRSAEIGITIGEADDRGQGLGTEAMRLAVSYCWRQLNLQRLGLRVYGANPAALACYRKVGFVQEGVLRRAACLDGEYVDVTLMAVLRDI